MIGSHPRDPSSRGALKPDDRQVLSATVERDFQRQPVLGCLAPTPKVSHTASHGATLRRGSNRGRQWAG